MDSIFPFKNCESVMNSIQFINGKESSNSLVIIGPKSCKTSLMMQAAITEASRGKQVLFVSPKKLSKLPPTVHGMQQPSSEIMKNIQFLYAKDENELQSYFSSMHLGPLFSRPSVIMVDELNYYCSASKETSELISFCKITSLIYNASNFAQENGESFGKDCIIMVWNVGDQDSLLKLNDIENFAMKLCFQVWTTKQESRNVPCLKFRMKTQSIRGTLSLIYNLWSINPMSQGIFVEDISMESFSSA